MKSTEISIADNACYGVFNNGIMIFHGTMSDCIEVSRCYAEDKEGEMYRIGLAEPSEEYGRIVLGTPIMTYTRDGGTIYVINELF